MQSVKGVAAPLVHGDLDAAETGNRIDYVQGVTPLQEGTDLGNGILHARRRLAMDDGDDLVGLAADLPFRLLYENLCAPWEFELVDAGTEPRGHFSHAAAEEPVDEDKHPVARLDQIGEGRLHSGRSCPRYGDREIVPGVHDAAKQHLNLIADFEKVRVEMAQRPFAERSIDLGKNERGACSHKKKVFDMFQEVIHLRPLSFC